MKKSIASSYVVPGTPNGSGQLIINAVAELYNVTAGDVKGTKRTGPIAEARQTSVYFIKKKYPKLSLQRIGFMVNRDHSTVIHSIRAIENRININQLLIPLKSIDSINVLLELN